MSTSKHRSISSAAKDDDPCHHLPREPSGYWQLRITVDRGREIGCLPVVVCLDTRSEQAARDRRDLVMAAIEKARLVAGEGE